MSTRKLRPKKPKPQDELFSEKLLLPSKNSKPNRSKSSDNDSDKENKRPINHNSFSSSSKKFSTKIQNSSKNVQTAAHANHQNQCSTPSRPEHKKAISKQSKITADKPARLPFRQLSISDLDEQGRNNREVNEKDTFDFSKSPEKDNFSKSAANFSPCSPVAIERPPRKQNKQKSKQKPTPPTSASKKRHTSDQDNTKNPKSKQAKIEAETEESLPYISKLFNIVEEAGNDIFKKLANKSVKKNHFSKNNKTLQSTSLLNFEKVNNTPVKTKMSKSVHFASSAKSPSSPLNKSDENDKEDKENETDQADKENTNSNQAETSHISELEKSLPKSINDGSLNDIEPSGDFHNSSRSSESLGNSIVNVGRVSSKSVLKGFFWGLLV